MRKLLLATATAAALVAVAPPAFSATYSYELVGVTDSSFNDTFSGTFSYDTTTDRTFAVSIVVSCSSGTVCTNPGTYTGGGYLTTNDGLTGLDFSSPDLYFAFANPITGAADPVVTIEFAGTGFKAATGEIAPTPLPAAFPLFATSLGAMGLFGWRRKRKNAPAISAA
jgi:hypothetical protein